MRVALEPEALLAEIARRDPHLRRERYYGERSLFYNPGRARPLGVIYVSVKDRDGPNDRASELSRAGVYRFAFGLPRPTFADLFGSVPRRPAKGEAVALPGHDLTRLGELTPHPVYAWMGWVQILCPTREDIERLEPLLAESLRVVKAKGNGA